MTVAVWSSRGATLSCIVETRAAWIVDVSLTPWALASSLSLLTKLGESKVYATTPVPNLALTGAGKGGSGTCVRLAGNWVLI